MNTAARSVLLVTGIIVAFANLFAAFAKAGETPSYAVSRWDMQDGLPLNKVRAVAQTPDGYLWVGTFNGLARFDGVRFAPFDVANTPELASNGIESLGVDSNGRLWIGDNSGRLTMLGQHGFQRVALPSGWPRKPVLRLLAARSGIVWAVNEDGSVLACQDGKVLKLIRVRANPSLFTLDPDGVAWMVVNGALHRVSEIDGISESSSLALEGRWQAVFRGRHGIWILNDGWLRCWRESEWVEDRGRSDWGTIVLAAFIETRDGTIAGGSFKEGLRIVNPEGTTERYDETNGLAHNWAYCVFEDREGTLWVGTGNGGLHGLNRRRIAMVDAPDQWRSSAVLSVTPAAAGGLWIGTEGGGVYRLRDGRVSSLPNRGAIWQAVANSVLEDRGGRLWVGTWSSGLRYWDEGEFKPAYRANDGRNVVLTVFETKAGDIWAGTRSGPGRYRRGTWEWVQGPPELQSAAVRCFSEDQDGALWCGTDGAGLFRVSPGSIVQYRADAGLAGDHIRTLLADPDGALWIGTRSGLSRFLDGRFTTLTTRHGLPSNVICHIVDGGDGQLWMSSLAGVFRVSRSDLNRCATGESASVQCVVCDRSSGLATLEMSEQGQPAGCRTPDGRLWFATGKGLATVNPAAVRENSLPPPVLIEELVVDGVSVTLARAAASSLRVAPGGRLFEFRYTGLSLTNPGRVGFRYRLQGLHEDWIEAGAQRTAIFTKLSSGNYTFEVMARNPDGIWNTQGASLPLRVLPHFWQTWWFHALSWFASASAAGSAGLLLVRRRTRRRLDVLERQRALERERSRIARDIHDDLGANLTRIVMLSDSARGAADSTEDGAAHLAEINQTGRNLTLQLSEIVWAISPEHDTLDSFANYIGNYARSFLERTGVRCRLDVPVALPPLPLVSPVRHNLFLAFKEALNNAVRHATATSILVTLRHADDRLTLTIQDNGRGIRRGTAEPEGNGLRNMARRLADVGGRCEIDGPAGQGTRVLLEVPVRGNA